MGVDTETLIEQLDTQVEIKLFEETHFNGYSFERVMEYGLAKIEPRGIRIVRYCIGK